MTHYHKIINTLLNSWNCYGMVVEKNKFCQSIARSIPKLRERLDTSDRDTSKGFIGRLKFEGKTYKWYEKMDGRVKYFYLEEVAERNNFVEQPIISNIVNGQLFDKKSLGVAV